MNLPTLWYLVIAVSILAYAVLDGFDLGVGCLHLFGRNDHERRTFLNAIGPVWDGNEVWIVIVMGGLFAGFPGAYATIFSGFYTLLMFLIAGLMFRAVAIEFRSKRESHKWRNRWDVVFALSSMLVALVLGIVVGNFIQGVPLNDAQDYIGTFQMLLRPYALLVGLLSVALVTMHGALYLHMKTEGEPHKTVRRWIGPSIAFFIITYLVTTYATIRFAPHMIAPFRETPVLALIPALAILAIFNIRREVRRNRSGWAFISSCIAIALLLGLLGIGTYPVIVFASNNPAYSLTIYNTASSPGTLINLLIVVAIGVPLVLVYGYWIYRIFRGKVRLDKSSY